MAEVGTIYGVIEVHINPVQHGKPNKRPRRMTFGWLASHIDFHGNTNEFEALIARKTMVNGDVFFVDEIGRDIECRQMAANQLNFVHGTMPYASAANLPLEYFFEPRTMEIIGEHEEEKEALQADSQISRMIPTILFLAS